MAEYVNGVYTAPSGRVYYEDEQKKKAQQYAQAALEGKGPGRYLSPAQTVNAVINAQVPIKPVEDGGADPASAAEVMLGKYLSELERQRAEKQAALDARYNRGKQSINENAAASNKDAYVSYMLGMKNMPQKSVMYGSGGMAQSLANKSQLNYENARAGIQKAKNESLADLEADYRAGVLDAGNDYLTKLTAAQDKVLTLNKNLTGTTSGGSSGFRIGNNQTVHSSLEGVMAELMAMGFTAEEARRYVKRQQG